MRSILISVMVAALLLLCISGTVMAAVITSSTAMALDDPGVPGEGSYGVAAITPPNWDAALYSDTIPASMTVNRSYPVSVTLTNTGTKIWTSARKIMLGAQGADATGCGPEWVNITPESTVVSPGKTFTFSFTINAPSSAGSYTLNYQMVRDVAPRLWFGQVLGHPITVSSGSGGGGGGGADTNASQLSDKIVTRTNRERVDTANLTAYVRNARLNTLAASHSQAMAASHVMSHDAAGDGSFSTRLSGYSSAGENIAFVSTAYPGNLGSVAKTMMYLWVDDDAGSAWGHRLNILDGETSDEKTADMRGHPYRWTRMGVGAAYGECSIGGRLWSGWFVTQDFARP